MSDALTITGEALTALRGTPHAIARDDAVVQVEGPGALACLQGIFTNDIERAGEGALLWGAVLTPKGMVIADLWLWHRGDHALMIVPAAGVDEVLALLKRSFPPRLAKVTDRRGTHAVWWLVGSDPSGLDAAWCARPSGPAPFAALAVGDRTDTALALDAAGWRAAPGSRADVLALLAGWPVLGREIDARTLVQEVRFDELEGVRYDKGCYVGQETVSRLHFRGHPNRTLRAVVGRGEAPAAGAVRDGADREVGSVATMLQIDDHWIASSKLRREVADGDPVTIGGVSGIVTPFPITTLP